MGTRWHDFANIIAHAIVAADGALSSPQLHLARQTVVLIKPYMSKAIIIWSDQKLIVKTTQAVDLKVSFSHSSPLHVSSLLKVSL